MGGEAALAWLDDVPEGRYRDAGPGDFQSKCRPGALIPADSGDSDGAAQIEELVSGALLKVIVT